MATMANITVNNAAGAAVVYNAASPSAGDRSPAVWRQNGIGSTLGGRPIFTLLTRDNGTRTARHVSATFKFPLSYTDPVSGKVSTVATIPFTLEGTLPTNVDVAQIKEAYVQLGNLLVSSLVRASVEEGYAPT